MGMSWVKSLAKRRVTPLSRASRSLSSWVTRAANCHWLEVMSFPAAVRSASGGCFIRPDNPSGVSWRAVSGSIRVSYPSTRAEKVPDTGAVIRVTAS